MRWILQFDDGYAGGGVEGPVRLGEALERVAEATRNWRKVFWSDLEGGGVRVSPVDMDIEGRSYSILMLPVPVGSFLVVTDSKHGGPYWMKRVFESRVDAVDAATQHLLNGPERQRFITDPVHPFYSNAGVLTVGVMGRAWCEIVEVKV